MKQIPLNRPFRDRTALEAEGINPYVASHLEFPEIIPAEQAEGWKGRWPEAFGTPGPVHLEIGSGNGFYLSGMAAAHPELRHAHCHGPVTAAAWALGPGPIGRGTLVPQGPGPGRALPAAGARVPPFPGRSDLVPETEARHVPGRRVARSGRMRGGVQVPALPAGTPPQPRLEAASVASNRRVVAPTAPGRA